MDKAGQVTLESGGSFQYVCLTNNVQGNQLYRYIQRILIMEERLNGTTRSTVGLKTLIKGCVSSVKPIGQPLLEWILHLSHMRFTQGFEAYRASCGAIQSFFHN